MHKLISFLKFIFYISILFLIILSLFPGSLLGLLFFGNIEKEPNLINNPFGTTINHFLYYFYVSILGLCLYLRSENFNKIVFKLFFLSIILEVLQLIVPNRTFQLYDLIGNFLGVLVAYFLVKIYLTFNRS
jgi:VanZ family protein